jgi:hypothetical protein
MAEERALTAPIGAPRDLLHLRNVRMRLVFALIFATQVVLAVASISGVHAAWPVVAGLVVFAAGFTLVALPHPDPFPAVWIVGVLTSSVLTNVLVLWNLPANGRPGYADWSFGAAAWLFFFLAFRGRIAAAWFGWVLIFLLTQIWSVTIGETPLQSINHVGRHAGTILIAMLFRGLLVRAAQRTAALHEERLLRVAVEAASLTERREREAQGIRLRDEAKPVLRQIAAGDYLEPEHQKRYRLLEATLRDVLRGGELVSRDVARAVEQARIRGVEVILMDDRNTPLTEHDSMRLEAVLIEELSELDHGRLTARLVPAGRGALASVVSTSGDSRRRVDLVDDLQIEPPVPPPVRVPPELF